MHKLKAKYITLINNDPELFGAIAKASGKKISTVSRWLAINSSLLTMIGVLNVIGAHTGDQVSELTEIAKP